jgi:hypothetical protein
VTRPIRIAFAVLLAATLGLVVKKTFAAAPAPLRFTLVNVQPAYRVGDPVMLDWRLTNQGERPLLVLVAMATPGRIDYDAINVTLVPAGMPQSGPRIEIGLAGMRTASARSMKLLAPGESITQSFDLALFAKDQGTPIKPGHYRMMASYELGPTGVVGQSERPQAYLGRVDAPPVDLTILP